MKKFLTAAALAASLLCGGSVFAEDTGTEVMPEGNPSHLEIVLVLDKSGSMSGLEKDTIGGYNSMIEKEKKLGIDANVTTVLFSDEYRVVHDRKSLADIEEMTASDYMPGGMTALLDAVGRTIQKMDMVDGIHRKDAGNKVLFVIITDGEENYSKEYNYASVRKLIEDRQKESGWEFVFLGANIDAAAEADGLGISRDNAVNYKNTGSGVRANFNAVARMSEDMAKNGSIASGWKSEVEEDEDAARTGR